MAILSVSALLVVLLLAMFLKTNVGLLGMAFAFVIATIGNLEISDVIAGFPSDLFAILVGVTFLFGIAHQNGTLNVISRFCIRLVKGKAALLPFVFCAIGFVISSLGAGSITMTAMLYPIAMVIADKEKISPLMMASMLGLLAIAGDYSPVSVMGAMISGFYAQEGIFGLESRMFIAAAVIYGLIGFAIYLFMGGLKLWKRGSVNVGEVAMMLEGEQNVKIEKKHIFTLIGILLFVIGVIFFKYHTGLCALTVGIVLCMLKIGDEEQVIKNMPWQVILLVSGVTILVKVMQITGGVDLAVQALASISNQATLIPIVTFLGVLVGTFTSNMGVVFPAFIPMLTPLVDIVGGVNPSDLYTAFTVTSCLADISPLSTIGALALAAATPAMDKTKLFRELLLLGLSMTIIGTAISWLLIPVLGIL